MMTHTESQKEIVKKMKNEISNELKIIVLEKKIERLEKTIKDFMDKWGSLMYKNVETSKGTKFGTRWSE